MPKFALVALLATIVLSACTTPRLAFDAKVCCQIKSGYPTSVTRRVELFPVSDGNIKQAVFTATQANCDTIVELTNVRLVMAELLDRHSDFAGRVVMLDVPNDPRPTHCWRIGQGTICTGDVKSIFAYRGEAPLSTEVLVAAFCPR